MKLISILKDLRQKSIHGVPMRPRLDTFNSGPESDDQIKKLERFIGNNLPEEHKAILQTFGACGLKGEKAAMTFFSVNELINDLDKIEQHEGSMTNTSLIAADNGGYLYFYDLTNKTSCGFNSIFLCYPGNMSWEDSQFIGSSLEAVISEIISGKKFEDKPFLGKLNAP